MHPNGDEIVMLMSGAVEFILKQETGKRSVTLNQQGQYVIIPKGVWHTAKTNHTSKLIFITPGEGTQHSKDIDS